MSDIKKERRTTRAGEAVGFPEKHDREMDNTRTFFTCTEDPDVDPMEIMMEMTDFRRLGLKTRQERTLYSSLSGYTVKELAL